MDKIKPKVKKDEYELDDYEYLFIMAIRDLTDQLRIFNNR